MYASMDRCHRLLHSEANEILHRYVLSCNNLLTSSEIYKSEIFH